MQIHNQRKPFSYFRWGDDICTGRCKCYTAGELRDVNGSTVLGNVWNLWLCEDQARRRNEQGEKRTETQGQQEQ